MTGLAALQRFLDSDPRDVGCDEAIAILHVYAELLADDRTGAEAARRFPGVAAHVRDCGPCAEDLDGLLMAIADTADGASGSRPTAG